MAARYSGRTEGGISSGGILDQALLGVLQLAVAPLAAQLAAVEAELSRLSAAVQCSTGSKDHGDAVATSPPSFAPGAGPLTASPAAASASAPAWSASRATATRGSRSDLDNSADAGRGTLVVEVDADRADLLRRGSGPSTDANFPSSSAAERSFSAGRHGSSPSRPRGALSAGAGGSSSLNSSSAGALDSLGGPKTPRGLRARPRSATGRTPPSTAGAGGLQEDLFDATSRFRDDGNALFRNRDYDGAAQHYAMAIDELSERTPGWPSRVFPRAGGSSGRAASAVGLSEGADFGRSGEANRPSSSPREVSSSSFRRLGALPSDAGGSARADDERLSRPSPSPFRGLL